VSVPAGAGTPERYGNDVRIGRGYFIVGKATILANVTIGDDCIIGAGAVVAGNIPSGSFAAGVPATVRRRLRDDGGSA